MTTLHPNDFESTEGRKKIMSFLHELDAKIHRLEQTVHELSNKEMEIEGELMGMVKIEGIEEQDATSK